MADPSAARVKSPEEEDVDDEEDELRQQENDENEPHSDEDEDDLKKPSWVGYFRLPRDDVERGPVFFPNDDLLPEHARPKKANSQTGELYSGWWQPRDTSGKPVGNKKKVLVKPIGFLREREARILSLVAGTDELSEKYNIIRFFGAVLYQPRAEYKVILEYCDAGFLRDLVLDTALPINAIDLSEQIANGMRYLHYGAPYYPILHRNLHPLSVLLKTGQAGRKIVKLHGFEHAKIMGPHETFGGATATLTNPGLWLGPEINMGVRTKTESDVYSYGMIVWHIFSRKLPFEGKRMTDPQIVQLTLLDKKRPDMPPCENCPKLWEEVISRSWSPNCEDRPDFIKIKKAITFDSVKYLDPHKPLTDEELMFEKKEEAANWELSPESLPVETGQILSSNKISSIVVIVKCDENEKKTVLKKPIKDNVSSFKVTKEQFGDYMAVAKTIDSNNVLKCEGVLLKLESLQFPLMDISARQQLKGKRIKDTDNRVKTVEKGFGSMTRKQVIHTMTGVLKGLDYLHTTTKIPHGGLSTSNVLITKTKKSVSTWKVCLCDYNLQALGTESYSHKQRYLPPDDIRNTPRGDLHSCSVMFVELYTGKDPVDGKEWSSAQGELDKCAKIWKAFMYCQNYKMYGSNLSARDVLAVLTK